MNDEDLEYLKKQIEELIEIHGQKKDDKPLTSLNNIVPIEIEPKMTREQAVALVKESPLMLRDIPREYITIEMYEEAVDKNPINLRYVCPRKYITPNNVVKFVNYDPLCIRYVPEEFVTLELAKFAVKKNVEAMAHIPYKFLSEELILYALNINGLGLMYVPEERKTKYFCELAFSNNFSAFKYVPNKFKTYDMCKSAVIRDSHLIKYVPVKILNDQFIDEIYSAGIKIPKECIGYVNKCLSVNKKNNGIIQEQKNVEDNDNKNNESNIPDKFRNIYIQTLTDFFSGHLLNRILKIGIVNLGQLLDFSETKDFVSYFKKHFDEISNTIRLLRCKYLNEEPLIDMNDENLDSRELYRLLGLSEMSKNGLLRGYFCKNAKEFFKKIKDPDVKEELMSIRIMGDKSYNEIMTKANIIIEYYQKRDKRDSHLPSNESLGASDLTNETLQQLNSELQRLYGESKKIDEQTDFVLSELQKKMLEQSKGGALK